MKYSIARLHKEKSSERQEGRTVDVLMNGIGQIMVTENKTIYLVVPFLNRWHHIEKEFVLICRQHFDVVPVIMRQFEMGIKGYSSRMVLINYDMWDREYRYKSNLAPLWDN